MIKFILGFFGFLFLTKVIGFYYACAFFGGILIFAIL